MPPPPQIQTYHCLCTSLLLASTHTLSTLPRRQGSTLDGAIILPLPSSPPNHDLNPSRPLSPSASLSPSPSHEEANYQEAQDLREKRRVEKSEEKEDSFPSEGYTLLLSMTQDRKTSIVRLEEGFERRMLWRCGRCRLVVGYEIEGSYSMDVDVDMDGEEGIGKGDRKRKEWKGKVLYLLPGGVMSTDVMMGGDGREGRRVGEGDVDIRVGGVGVFE